MQSYRTNGAVASFFVTLGAAFLLTITVVPKLLDRLGHIAILASVLIGICTALAIHIHRLIILRVEQQATENALRTSEKESESIFQNAPDAILVVNDAGVCLKGNQRAERLLRRHQLNGVDVGGLLDDACSAKGTWLKIINGSPHTGETRLRVADSHRPVVEYSAKANYLPGRHLVSLRDVTDSRAAELRLASSLSRADSATAEAEGLRKTMLSIAEGLSMDHVLDRFLRVLMTLVPCDSAAVLLCESKTRLFVARELTRYGRSALGNPEPKTLSTNQNRFAEQVLVSRQVVSVADTAVCSDWNSVNDVLRGRAWLGVPLILSNQSVGLLSLASLRPHAFTDELARLAASFGVPAAIAIENARLREEAYIYGSELEQRLSDPNLSQNAPRRVGRNHST